MVAFAISLLRKFFSDLQLALLLCFIFLSPTFCYSQELLLGTDIRGSFSYFTGKWLCHTLNAQNGNSSCKIIQDGDPTSRLVNLNNGALDIALINSKEIYDGLTKQGNFQFIDITIEDLRLLLPFYREPISIITKNNKDIETIDDLPGKRINTGPPLSLETEVFDKIMTMKGWKPESFSTLERLSSRNSQDLIAFNNGVVQALLHIGMHPDPQIERVITSKSGKVIGVTGADMERLAKAKSGFCKGEIQAGAYSELKDKVETLAMENYLITSSDTDEETVEWLLESILDARKELQQAHPSFLNMKIDIETLNSSYLHPHPSAILFFQANLHRLEDN